MSRQAIKIRAVKLYDAGMRIKDIHATLVNEYPLANLPYSTVKTWVTKYRQEILDAGVPSSYIEPLKVSQESVPSSKTTIALIGDMQVKPDIDLSYCQRVGRYMAHKKPDIIVNIGDFADMPSLSFHDVPGSMGYEGQRYKNDILSVHRGMKLMMEPIQAEMARTGWKPRLVMTLGNHEDRINRTIKATPKLDGLMGLPDLEYERWGWEVIPFLKPIEICGVMFSHYFCTGVMGRPFNSAKSMLTKMAMSCCAGHQQGRDMAMGKRADGTNMTAIICGSTYEHDEGYLNHQTNNHWRGLYILHDVRNGEFEECAVTMRYLRSKYGE